MEEKQQNGPEKSSALASSAPLILGLVVALSFGWWIFPDLMFSEKQQPVAFSHKVHVEDQAMECAQCHFTREDGSFSGIPTTEACAECHMTAQGETKAELDYVANYVEQEKEPKWLVHQKQPDNVFFSHTVHSVAFCATCHPDYESKPEMLCTQCHPSTEELDKQIPYKENVLSKYSKTTMKMWQCERCHAVPDHLDQTNANNACYTCHK